MAVSKRLRFEILRRDNHACRYCGAKAPDVVLQVDHVNPVALGGTNSPSNLVAACEACNSGKGYITADDAVVEDVAQDAIRWAMAIRRAMAEQVEDRQPLLEVTVAIYESWTSFRARYQNSGETYQSTSATAWMIPLPVDFHASVERLWRSGLKDRLSLLLNVDIAMGAKLPHKDRWAYFCGVGWKQVSNLQERARQILSETEV